MKGKGWNQLTGSNW